MQSVHDPRHLSKYGSRMLRVLRLYLARCLGYLLPQDSSMLFCVEMGAAIMWSYVLCTLHPAVFKKAGLSRSKQRIAR